MDTDLNFAQLRAFTASKRGYSVALLGGAGSGKSFRLNRFLDCEKDIHGEGRLMACAWTNQAARNIWGRNIHSYFGISFGYPFHKEELWKSVRKSQELDEALQGIQIVFIDEVSVLKEKVLDAIDPVMRYTAKKNRLSCMPMGGNQLVLAGDPFQHEPISVDYDKEGERGVFGSSMDAHIRWFRFRRYRVAQRQS